MLAQRDGQVGHRWKIDFVNGAVAGWSCDMAQCAEQVAPVPERYICVWPFRSIPAGISPAGLHPSWLNHALADDLPVYREAVTRCAVTLDRQTECGFPEDD